MRNDRPGDMRRMPEVAGRVVRGEGGDRAADGPRVRVAKEISPLPCYPQGPGEKQNNKQGVMMMSEETGKTKAIIDLAASNLRMRELLHKVAGIAEAALDNQPHEDGTCWRHLSKAIGELRKAMRPEPGTLVFMDELAWFEKKMEELRSRMEPTAGSGAFFTNDKTLKEVAELVKPRETPLDPNAPEMVRGGEPDEKKAIGNFAGVGKVVSYAIGRDMTVTVTARTAGEGEWVFEGIKDGKLVIEGNILGGKWAAAQYCKFLRNGIVSRAKKVWKNHHRRSEKAAAALAGARSDAGKAVAE